MPTRESSPRLAGDMAKQIRLQKYIAAISTTATKPGPNHKSEKV
jgi:hypothetical protein